MACTDNVMRALFLLALFCVMHGEKEESKRIDAKASGPGGSFDITKLGASGNGKIDNTKAVQEAWASACGDTGKQTILIPKGDFLVGQLNFTGPCKGDVTIHVDGNLLSTMDLSQYKIPCTGVTMDDINVEYSGTNNKTMAICTNAKGSTKGCLKELACF
ncbi:Pectin lyase-like superfamily protein [Zea mays]|uniref:Pectin lyase-like superfamily protein n=1 Tax=Zea mays TaxID=4577 RepID=A0A1D6LRL0_MAIZE|nr:Pectin lyase-like superfamily protein [Zea mays]